MEFGALPIANDWKSRPTEAKTAFAQTAEWGVGDVTTADAWLDRWDDNGRVIRS